MKRIYLDYCATTPLDPRVLDAMVPHLSGNFGNPSSVHSYGREARSVLDESRDRISRFIGARPDEVFFTSGGTEADNQALYGVARAARKKGRNHIVTSVAEHHAVMHSAEALKEDGFEVTFVPVTQYGAVDPDAIRIALRPTTCLVSIMHANNEVGSLNPVKEIARIVREHGAFLHSDTVQSTGKIRVDVNELGVDLAAISAHKFYGPKGIGALYIRKGTPVDPLIRGGSQESNRRAGTENVAFAAGFAKAAELCDSLMETEREGILKVRESLQVKLEKMFPEILFNGHPTETIPHVLNVSFDSSRTLLDGDALIMGMDLQGVAVTSGSACTSGSLQPSHVLLAMGRDAQTARATVRFSLGRWTTEEEIDQAVDALQKVIQKICAARTSR